jgi:beta-lactam-binding protein with PASTA domain
MSKINEFVGFLKSRMLWLNVLGMIVFIFALLWGINAFLLSYTRHGQQLELPDFTQHSLEKARDLAGEHNYELIVDDSVHVIGKEGGIVLRQNPEPGSKVKEGRKVYLTTSKYIPDMVDITSLPELYGKNYTRKERELRQGFALQTRISGKKYDNGPENHILAVIFRGDTIIDKGGRVKNLKFPKGATLDMVISTQSGGKVPIPNLRCMTYAEAKFIIESYRLTLGPAEADGTVADFDEAFIWRQEPPFEEGTKMEMGSPITVFLTAGKPIDCNE